jgi:hypothetical protein
MNCKDCIHYDACNDNAFFGEIEFYRKTVCEHFKDKGLVIDLPCKVGTPVFIVNKTHGCVYKGKFRLDDIDQVGKRIFLTEEAAKKVIKGR